MTLLFVSILVATIIAYPRALFFWSGAESIVGKLKLNLGLDLQGGVHLEYQAQTENITESKIQEAVEASQAVIERRVNAFGVSEPLVQTAQSGGDYRIIVELPGVKDIEEAKSKIREAPFLEFKEEDTNNPAYEQLVQSLNTDNKHRAENVLQKVLKGDDFEALAKENSQDPGSKDNGGDLDFVKKGVLLPAFESIIFDDSLVNGKVYPQLVETQYGWHIIKKEETRGEGDNREVRSRHILFVKRSVQDIPTQYKETGLNGSHLKSARVEFGGSQGLGEPQVAIQFDDEGTKLFADITKRNLKKTIAIYIDGQIVTAPTVQSEITSGEAVITGNYSLDEAKILKKRLDEGALPVPLKLVAQQSIEASLGQQELRKSIIAGFAGFGVVAIFMIAYYRLLGFIASIALVGYAVFLISIFKLSSISGWPFPITLTLSGIAGFVLSIGMAVDANVLIFERMKEEVRKGRSLSVAIREGFNRAWPSIRDGNYSTILTTMILVWFGTGFVKGFAIILMLGVVMSMFTALVVVRIILSALPIAFLEKRLWLFFPSKVLNGEDT